MPQKLIVSASQRSLWYQLVRESAHELAITLSEPAESYLVFMLQRLTRLPNLERALAMDYLQALQLPGRQRIRYLQATGDKSLLLAGFFPQQAQYRGVSRAYFIEIGQAAYAQLAELDDSEPQLFKQLAADFTQLQTVLSQMRQPKDVVIDPSDTLWGRGPLN